MSRPESKLEALFREVCRVPNMREALMEALEEERRRADEQADKAARASLFSHDLVPKACAAHGAAAAFRTLIAMVRRVTMKE